MRTYEVREWRDGKLSGFTRKPYKQEKRARELAEIVKKNMLVEKVDILVREYGENEQAGDYSESIISL